jgi:hypothetical protein
MNSSERLKNWNHLKVVIQIIPVYCQSEYFGKIETNMWTWSDINCPSITSHSFCRASFRNMPSKYILRSPHINFLRHFGIHKWYLYPYVVWLKFWLLHTGSLLFSNFEQFKLGDFPYIPVNVKLWESPGRAGRFFFNYMLACVPRPGLLGSVRL